MPVITYNITNWVDVNNDNGRLSITATDDNGNSVILSIKHKRHQNNLIKQIKEQE